MKEKISYGAGGFSIQILTNTISTYFLLFLTNAMGLPPLAAGQLIFRIKVIDAFTDVICATAADKFQAKTGSYLPFLRIFSFPAAIFFVLNFWAPDFLPEGSRLIWAYVIYFFTSTIFATLNNIPYTALNAVMTQDRQEQSSYAAARTVGENIAAIIITYFGYKIITSSGSVNNISGWRIMAVVFAVLAVVGLQLCAKGVKERYPAIKKEEGEIPLKTRLLALRGNVPLFGVIGIVAFFVLTNNYFITYFNYYCIYSLGHEEWTAGLSTVGNVITMAVAVAIPVFVRRFEKRHLITFGVLCGSSSYLIFYFAKSYSAIFAGQLLRGFGAAFIMTNIWALLPECAAYGKWKTGISSTALVSSLMLLTLKIFQACANYFVGFTLDMIGFEASLAQQSEYTLNSIRTCIAIGPACLSLVVIVFTFLLKGIDKERMLVIRKELEG